MLGYRVASPSDVNKAGLLQIKPKINQNAIIIPADSLVFVIVDLSTWLLLAVTVSALVNLQQMKVKVLACRCDYVRFPHGCPFFPRLLLNSATVLHRCTSYPLRCSYMLFLVPGTGEIEIYCCHDTTTLIWRHLVDFVLWFRERELWTFTWLPRNHHQHEVFGALWTFKIRGYRDDSRQSTARYYCKTITLWNNQWNMHFKIIKTLLKISKCLKANVR